MPDADSDVEEAMTREEIYDEEPPEKRPRNAFSELMRPKPKPKPASPQPPRHQGRFAGRMGLGAYLADPGSTPGVIFHTADFVAIHDKFPKATVHALLLARSPERNLLHPFEALADEGFRSRAAEQAGRLRGLVASELRRRAGRDSAADARRQAVLDGEAEPDDDDGGEGEGGLPAGRDWTREVLVGVHAVPSMAHLHIHVLSRDMVSPALRHRKHYNSFTTPFLVPLGDLPLAADDPRRRAGEERYLARGMRCWRCGRDFGGAFGRLKDHLDEEFEEWRRE